MDSVVGLGIVRNKLVSGSKDKNLKLWSLDSAVNNAKHTLHVFNDYVTTVQGISIFIKCRLSEKLNILFWK